MCYPNDSRNSAPLSIARLAVFGESTRQFWLVAPTAISGRFALRTLAQTGEAVTTSEAALNGSRWRQWFCGIYPRRWMGK